MDRLKREEHLERIELAYQLASAHQTGYRKDGKTPEIVHSAEVALEAAIDGHDADRIIAYLLHDMPEDHNFKVKDISDLFGERVGSIVDMLTDPRLLVDEAGKPVRKKGRLQWIYAKNDLFYSLRADVPPEYRDAKTREKYTRLHRFGTADDWLGKIYDAWHNLKTIRFLSEERQHEYKTVFVQHISPILERFDPATLKRIGRLLRGVKIPKTRLPPSSEPYRIFPERHRVIVSQLPSADSKTILIYTPEAPKFFASEELYGLTDSELRQKLERVSQDYVSPVSFELQVPKKYDLDYTAALVKARLLPRSLEPVPSILGSRMGQGSGHIFRFELQHALQWPFFLGRVKRFHADLLARTPREHASNLLSVRRE